MKQEHENKSFQSDMEQKQRGANQYTHGRNDDRGRKDNEMANKEQQREDADRETKERGGNHNPAGANQYTHGRVDDRGRKDLEDATQQQFEDRPAFGEQHENVVVVEREPDANENTK